MKINLELDFHQWEMLIQNHGMTHLMTHLITHLMTHSITHYSYCYYDSFRRKKLGQAAKTVKETRLRKGITHNNDSYIFMTHCNQQWWLIIIMTQVFTVAFLVQISRPRPKPDFFDQLEVWLTVWLIYDIISMSNHWWRHRCSGDAVGMSSVHEVVAARHCNMRYDVIKYINNDVIDDVITN